MEVFEEVGGKQVGVKKSDQVEVCYWGRKGVRGFLGVEGGDGGIVYSLLLEDISFDLVSVQQFFK